MNAAMDAALAIPVRMSVDEFVTWAAGAGGSWQLIDGVPHGMAPPSRTHGKLQSELARRIGNHLLDAGAPCDVITTPGIIPRLMSQHNMRVPDLAVTCSPFDREERALTDPILIVEILSPSNQADTWANVWAYTSLASVKEILVVRADRIGAFLLRRGVDDAWPERPAEIVDGLLELTSIGFSVSLADIYLRTPLQLH
jgi:Uma2 family endonuclease